MKKAFTLLELIVYIVFIAVIGLSSFFVIRQFLDLNQTLYSYKELKLDFLDFEKDFTDLLTLNYDFFTGGNKIILSGNSLVGYICSGTLQKASFDTAGNVIYIEKNWDKLPCNNLSGYYLMGINLDLNLKFGGTGLVLHYYFK